MSVKPDNDLDPSSSGDFWPYVVGSAIFLLIMAVLLGILLGVVALVLFTVRCAWEAGAAG